MRCALLLALAAPVAALAPGSMLSSSRVVCRGGAPDMIERGSKVRVLRPESYWCGAATTLIAPSSDQRDGEPRSLRRASLVARWAHRPVAALARYLLWAPLLVNAAAAAARAASPSPL